jgi:hypothetical protein
MHTELGEERLGGLEVVDNDADVVHSQERHGAAQCPSISMLIGLSLPDMKRAGRSSPAGSSFVSP